MGRVDFKELGDEKRPLSFLKAICPVGIISVGTDQEKFHLAQMAQLPPLPVLAQMTHLLPPP